MKKEKRIERLIDRDGMQIKMPKNRKELAELLDHQVTNAVRRVRCDAQDEVLYLQGMQSQRYIARNNMNTAANSVNVITNARPDIIHALADIGMANAKIAYSLMKALEGSK